MAGEKTEKETTPPDEEKTKRDGIKAVFKEALAEFMEENKTEKTRTETGKESAPKRSSIFDIFG